MKYKHDVLCFGVSEDVRFQVSGLGKLFIATIEGTDVWSVPCVDADVCPEVEV